MNSVIKKRYLFLVSLILVLVVGVVLTTLANTVWGSRENTTFDTTIGDIAGIKFVNGNSVNVSNMGPVLNYHDGANVEFAVFNRTNSTINISVILNISSISSNLKDSQFKYVLEKMNDSNEYVEIANGNFSSFVTGDNTILGNYSITHGYSYYRFYVYIDGSVSNNTNMMGNSLVSVLKITDGE